jgi:hypothetical protein
VRQNVDEKKAGRDLKKVEKRADAAEADAEVAVDFAHAAIEEAEYAVWMPTTSSPTAVETSEPRSTDRRGRVGEESPSTGDRVIGETYWAISLLTGDQPGAGSRPPAMAPVPSPDT